MSISQPAASMSVSVPVPPPRPPPRSSQPSLSSPLVQDIQPNPALVSSPPPAQPQHLEPLPDLSLPLSANYDASAILELAKEEQQSLSDEFLAHQRLFGFQSSNVRNQYEHLCFLIQNARDRYGEQAYAYLHARLFSNYRRWVNHINAQRWCFQKRIRHHFTDARYGDRNKLQDLVLWLLIWGEAANCRHMPEYLCFLFFRMSQARARVIESGRLPIDHSRDDWYRRHVIEPAYNIVQAMMQYQRNNGTLKDHVSRPHYDDINEYFWNRRWLDAGKNYHNEDTQHFWGNKFLKQAIDVDAKTGLPVVPQKEGSDRERRRKDHRRRMMKTFIERRTWLNLYHSFDRIAVLHLFVLHILLVFAWGFGSSVDILCSCVLTLAGLDAISEMLNVYFYWGVIYHLGMTINLLLRIVVKTVIFLVLLGLFVNTQHSFSSSTDGTWQDVWKYAAAGYFLARLVLELINVQQHRWLRKWHLSEDRNFESRVASQVGCRFFIQLGFWILTFGAKAIVSYFSYIVPLVSITQALYSVDGWAGRDGISRQDGNSYSNTLLVVALWVPTITIYLIDTQIFYSVFIVFVGLLLGVRDNVANVRSWDDIQRKWSWTWRRGARKFFGREAMSSVNVTAVSGVRNPLNLPQLVQPPWHLIHVLWRNIVEEMRATDMISYHDEQLLHFGHFQLITRPAPSIQPAIPNQPELPPRPARVQDFYFLPAFVTSGQLTMLHSITEACEETKHNKKRAAGLVVRQMRNALRRNEAMRTGLDELYMAVTLLLRIFIKDCLFDPSVEGNKLLDAIIRQQLPHSYFSNVLKQVSGAVNETISICFDMGYQNIVRKRPTVGGDGDEVEEGWMDRAEQVNTKNFASLLQALYKTWQSIELNLTPEQAAQAPTPVVLVNQLDEIENNGASTLLRVLHHLTSTASVDARPHNATVTDRLQFFLSSLNTSMPNRQNSIKEMYSWTVLTPYVDELVIYTQEDIQTPNDDGVTQEFYLQSVYRKEWLNFQERMEVDPRGHDPLYRLQQRREWCSYRGQTLLRTVRGMMFYEKALKVLALLEMAPYANGAGTPQQLAAAKAISRRKYQYVLSCQRYGQFLVARERRDKGELVDRKQLPDAVRKARKKMYDEAQKADDIEYILRKWPHLRVAYVDDRMEDGQKVFASVLVKAEEIRPEQQDQAIFNDANEGDYGIGGEIVEVYRVRLPGTILIGEGKPENQNHAIIFTRGEFTEAIDMNQDNYFEEALKMRNLLEEFDPLRLPDKHTDQVTRPNPVGSSRSQSGILQCAILGFREHIFTANLMSVGTYMSLMEATFVSITLRAFAFFGARMHYGHPDLLDKLFFMTRGGVSKSSKMLHVSEDIFAGFKSTLRGGRIFHREYTQCGKGRDLGFGQLFLFEAKLASGAGEQALSREAYRLGRYLDLPRLLSFFYGSIGFYTTTTLMVFSIVSMLFARMLLALTNIDTLVWDYDNFNSLSLGLLQGTSIFQLGLLLTFSMLAEIALEQSLVKALSTLLWMLITGSPLFFFFHMLTKAFFFNNSILYGGAKYRATGRGFVLSRDSFCLIYRTYARTHIYMAMKVLFMLVVFGIFYNRGSYIATTWSAILLLVAWLYGPVWFDPLAFDHDKVTRDFAEWKRWLTRVSTNEEDSWQAWWVNENDFIKRVPAGTRRLNIFLNLAIPLIIIVCCVANAGTQSWNNIYFLPISFGGTILSVFTFAFILSVFKPIGDSWRYFKFLLFFVVVGFAAFSIAVPPSDTTNRFKNFAVFIITVFLTFNAVCKCLVYYGAGPYHYSFVVHWFRWMDALYGLILYLPWLLISFFDFLSTVQTRLLYNQAFSKGLVVQSILHGRGVSVSGFQKRVDKKLDKDGNVVYARANSRYGGREGDDWEGAATPAEWERQEIIGRRSRIGLGSGERPDSRADSRAESGNASPMIYSHEQDKGQPYVYNKTGKGTIVDVGGQQLKHRGSFNGPAPDNSAQASHRPSALQHADSQSSIIVPGPNLSSPSYGNHPPARGIIYNGDGRGLERYVSDGDNQAHRDAAIAHASDPHGRYPLHDEQYSYTFNAHGGADEEKTDPVALVYNPISPGTALSIQARQREAMLAAAEDDEVRQVNAQHVDLDDDNDSPRSGAYSSANRPQMI